MRRGLTMKTLNWKVIVTAVVCVFLTTACSKKLMPPEIETSGNVSEGEFTASSESSGSDFAGSGGAEGSGFFSEEPILERGSSSSDGFSADMEADAGSGSSGSFGTNPFDSSGQGEWDPNSSGSGSSGSGSSGSGSSGSMDSGIQESRLQSFQASSDLNDIHFEFDQYDLDNNSKAVLKENADYLKHNPSLHVEVQGHCDERGTNNYNIALGERRAHSTKKYLVSQGVDSRRVHVISLGEEKPFCFDSNEACWHQNRRAHFMVSK
jgi:peptidoglycan-associated lipoprotein